ncbi:hypothetical protein POSPLADRAFT_1049289 [Postia placenta MAD-698-R-SB12]|uniref:HTH La-type RNA-binding domain-containing protein n=1 Tax=Postia placenta MAD-698-R-SB12 TaxID=670580 RepID=A0A1X6MPY3_9APHY|nr:hypothetical protein POSPLADRAFT_1049289 [Postia placenta MAD-698-R-SB12]OSX58455.1 hypothetical protein POSPLADRAFT_1049289 [Postia placenta MAD-698-R-SB12]
MAEVTIATPAVSDKATLKADPPHPEEVKDATVKVEQPAASNSETEAQSAPKGEEDAKAVVEGGDNKEKMLDAMRQIEFYFADSNLPFDKFMWTLHTANAEHWVPIKQVSSFKRMREYQPLGLEWITNALRLSEELEVSEDGTQVRRRTEVQEPKGQFERSVYAKGFGAETEGIQKRLEAFFNQYGKTNAVRMRRIDTTKEFKGSVFAEFADFKAVEKFLNADPKPSWNGEELLVMTKYGCSALALPRHILIVHHREAYCEMKIKEKGLTGKAASLRKQSIAGNGRRGFNAFKEMEREAQNKGKGGKGKEKGKPEIFLEFMGSKIRVQENGGEDGSVNEEDVPFVRGASLKFEGSGESVSFDEIKGTLKERFARVPFVKNTRGESSGLVGFDKALTEDEISYVKEHLKTLSGKEVTWSVPDEETEKAFQLERAHSQIGDAEAGAADVEAVDVVGEADVVAAVVGVAADAARETVATTTAALRTPQQHLRPTGSRLAKSENGPWSLTVGRTSACAGKQCL